MHNFYKWKYQAVCFDESTMNLRYCFMFPLLVSYALPNYEHATRSDRTSMHNHSHHTTQPLCPSHRKGFVPTGTGGAAAVAFPCIVLGFFGGGGGGGFLPILAASSGVACDIGAPPCVVDGAGFCTSPCPTPPPAAPA